MRIHLLSALFLLVVGACASVPKTQTTPSAAGAHEASATPPRQVVKTADLLLHTSRPREVFDRSVKLAQDSGGYTVDSQHKDDSSRVTLRVPHQRFETTLSELRKLGKVEKVEIKGRDVTGEMVDLEIRLENAEKARARYLELLAKAENVTAALPVQKELDRVTTKVEQLKGKLQLLRHQVSMSAIELVIKKPVRPGPLGWVFYGLYRGVVWLFVWD